jgi:hypothetical protein
MKSLAALLVFLSAAASASAETRSAHPWDDPRPITAATLFFGEIPSDEQKKDPEAPRADSKSYPWWCIDKGNAFFVDKDFEKAAVYFKAAYEAAGPTRVLAGFKLVEAYQEIGWMDSALDILTQLENRHLVAPREFQEAKRWRISLEDMKRKRTPQKQIEKFTGREWLKQISEWRRHYVKGAMDELRRHAIPLKESEQKYVFLFEERFLKYPKLPAHDAVTALAELVYERDQEARLPIDRWRISPDLTVTEEAKAADAHPNKLTGTEWITLVHEDKLDYTAQAMEVLKEQRVPMEKGLYAYTEALDERFTEDPELPAWDGAAALASVLYETEPKAKAQLDALRLR